jgi:N-acetylglucosaminyl-diphospho-decaprenol L-rhamnosyltransferase
MLPVISVIVLNYNGRQWLTGCLDALAAQAGAPAFEVIVVDNASTDGSLELIAARSSSVTLVRSATNVGFAAGNSMGAERAAGGALVFLNNDTVPAPDWLARLHSSIADRPGYGLATSRIVLMDRPDTLDSAGDGYLRAGGAFKRGHGGRADDYSASQEVFGACGAAFLIRRAVYDALGGFDARFFMVYEDVDLSYRARLLGHRCWYAADAVVRHAGSATLGVASPAAVFYGQRNLEWTWLKNTPRSLLIRSVVPHVIYAAAGLAHYARIGRFIPAVRGKWAALRGAPAILRDRRIVQRGSVADPRAVEQMMDTGWLALKRREKAARKER